MAVTRMDCHFFRGAQTSLDTSAYVALNPNMQPGTVVMAGAKAVRKSIGSQVACRLSLEHFTEGILEHFETHAVNQSNTDASLKALESAFRRANKSVYSFGHSLAAGGRMAAAFIGLVLRDNLIAAGRVAGGGAYLLRGSEVFPFFEQISDNVDYSDDYLGAQSMVSVELASVPIEEGDMLTVFSDELSEEYMQELGSIVADIDLNTSLNPANEIAQFLFKKPKELAFAYTLKLGPNGIFLV